MKVHVISDMEGVSGIVKWQQTTGGDPMYEEGRRLYTEEINAAVRGAKAAGAKEIVVMDCHGAGGAWTFNSLVPDLLDPDCEFAVQEGIGRYGARQIPAQRARELIEDGAKGALKDLKAVEPYNPGSPCTIDVEYKVTEAVDKLRHAPNVEIVDDRRIRSTATTWWDAWKQFFFFG